MPDHTVVCWDSEFRLEDGTVCEGLKALIQHLAREEVKKILMTATEAVDDSVPHDIAVFRKAVGP